MQREMDGGIIISCDFCGRDWDQQAPMIEGHRGSVICLDCFKRALDEAGPAQTAYDCTMCLQHREAGGKVWRHPNPTPSAGLNRQAAICWPDIRQAAKAFHKDKDIDFKWDPAKYPPEK